MKIDLYDLTYGVYKLVKGSKTGKIRYHGLYKKVTEYAKEHYENAKLSDLIKTNSGWSCIINDNKKSVVLYITKKADGEYSMWEKEI